MVRAASVVIWTTTPWTIPGNRAVNYSPRINYGLYEVTAAENAFGPQPGEKLIFAEALAEDVGRKGQGDVESSSQRQRREELGSLVLSHPLKGLGGGYEFAVPDARRRPCHRRCRHRLRAYRARSRPRGLRRLDGRGAGAAQARHRHGDPLHRRRRRLSSPRMRRASGRTARAGRRASSTTTARRAMRTRRSSKR